MCVVVSVGLTVSCVGYILPQEQGIPGRKHLLILPLSGAVQSQLRVVMEPASCQNLVITILPGCVTIYKCVLGTAVCVCVGVCECVWVLA